LNNSLLKILGVSKYKVYCVFEPLPWQNTTLSLFEGDDAGVLCGVGFVIHYIIV